MQRVGGQSERRGVDDEITDRVIKHHESVLTSDALVDFKGGHSVEGLQIRSVACVPLWNNREVIGLIYVDSRHRTGLFGEENLRLLTHLAHVVAVKIENARLYLQAVAAERMEQELLRASELQNHLLPSESPPIAGYRLYGSSVPCRAVGGDYYDYIELTGGRYGIGLGDVAGKGLSAALLMFAFQASLHALSELDLPPEETIGRLNRLLARKIPHLFGKSLEQRGPGAPHDQVCERRPQPTLDPQGGRGDRGSTPADGAAARPFREWLVPGRDGRARAGRGSPVLQRRRDRGDESTGGGLRRGAAARHPEGGARRVTFRHRPADHGRD